VISIINLDEAKVRFNDASKQLDKIQLEYKRVPAFDQSRITTDECRYVTRGIAAIWRSHIIAMRLFLESLEDFAIIMEDDFKITNQSAFIKSNSVFLENNLDLLQIGFLNTGIDVYLLRKLEHLQFSLLRLISSLGRRFSFIDVRISQRMRIRDIRDFSNELVPYSFLPGAHCYIISRKLAEEIIEMNNPQFLSTDDFLTALARMRSFRMCRLRSSAVTQSNLPSQVGLRFPENS
jgi:GR25 family glycosyltransferase involved in LPS biosynthesis